MATQILSIHWKAARLLLLPFVVAAFALPLVSVQGLGPGWAGDVSSLFASRLVGTYALWSPLYPLLACAVGAVLALTAWNWDHQQDHVYALSLPVGRGEYALLKLGAGVVLALVPTAAFLAGSLVAAASVDMPAGLNAYPLALTTRFFAATLLIYAFIFALASGTIRTTVTLLGGFLALLLFGSVLMDQLVVFFPSLAQTDVMVLLGETINHPLSPFRVLTGNWMLIDV